MGFMSPAGRSVGLHRTSSVTKWLIGATVALTGAFSWVAARSLPGKASAQNSNPRTSTQRSSSDDGFQQPLEPPTSDGFQQPSDGFQQQSGGFSQPVSGGS
ncbi:MAG: hypothetical protein ACXVQS_02095 [Actinomycetota bacterium]